MASREPDGSPIFDNIDIDMFVKVLAHTAFSPFFVFFIPIFYIFQGAKYTDPIIISSALYYVAISVFWFVKWYSRLYRNQGSLFFGPGRFDWGEQIVVVTGGASGVGELLANTLAVRNVTVIVLDINPIVTENYNISYYKCDVSKWEEVEAVSKKIIEEIGQPTVLVNNAGVVQGKKILDLSPKDIRQTFDSNTLAHFWTLKAFLPGMIEKGTGHIITIASVLGLAGASKLTDYSASKAAVLSLNDTLRYELDKHYNCPKIRTTVIIPGHILTPMFQTFSLGQAWWTKFIFPSLHPITMVKTIIAALDEQHSRTIYLPLYVQISPYLRIMPSFIRDFVQWVSNADYALEGFSKVTARGSSGGEATVPRGKKD